MARKTPVTEQRRAELLENPDVVAVVEAWESFHKANGRPLGLLQAAESALGAGYTVETIARALGVLEAAKEHPERFHEKSEPRWLLSTRRANLPSAVFSSKSLDGLLAVAPEPEQSKKPIKWEGVPTDA